MDSKCDVFCIIFVGDPGASPPPPPPLGQDRKRETAVCVIRLDVCKRPMGKGGLAVKERQDREREKERMRDHLVRLLSESATEILPHVSLQTSCGADDD